MKQYKQGVFFSDKFVGENSWNGYERKCLFANIGNGQFMDVARPTGSDSIKDGRGVAIADFNGDGKLDLVMRQSHRAGETLFVDYAGQTMPVVNALTGEVREAAIFIAVLGASNYTFAEATWSQSLPDWIGSHVRAFAALGGVPQVVVPDHLKAAVSRPHRYEPTLNRTYADLAQHYGVVIVPARAARPRDKAKVEVGVQVVERWTLPA